MSQLVLDEQLRVELLPVLRKWITVRPLKDLRPDQRILDDRAPALLQTLKQPTLITIDKDFWDRRLCNPNYCILHFALRDGEQKLIPGLLRALFHHPEFQTRARRMGKVAQVSTTGIVYWQFQKPVQVRITWPELGQKRR
jgi:hypothetical protein